MSPPQPSMYHHGALERLPVFRGLRATGNMVLRHVLRYPLRASVTVLGIAASVALLVSTLQFLDSIDLMVDDYFFRAQRQDVTVRLVDPRAPGVRNDLARLPGVLRVELRRSVAVRLRHGARSRRGVVQGIEHDATLAQQIDRAGHVVQLPPNGIVLSQRLAGHLDVQPGDILDVEFLEGRQRKASVRVAQVISEYVGLAAYMDLDALGSLSGDGSIADTAVLSTDPAATDQLFARAREAPGIFTVALQRTAYLKFRALLDQNIVTMLAFYVGFAAIIAFGVAYNDGRITFSERAREFATLRVLGYQASEVAGILLGELAVLTWIGLALGCVLGYGLAWLMIALFSSDLYQMPFALEPPTYAWSAIVALLAGGGSGALVARRVRKLDLVRVLKARD